jgi:hypothetical protein
MKERPILFSTPMVRAIDPPAIPKEEDNDGDDQGN